MDVEKNILEIAKDKGYYIDEQGQAFSKFRKLRGALKKTKKGYSYLYFAIKYSKLTDGKSKTVFIHRLQAFQKFGHALFEPGIEVRHLNNIKTDNSYENIGIGTRSDNVMDNPESVRKAPHYGMRKHDYDAIQADRANGMETKALMQKYNLPSRGGLYYILKH